MKEILKSFNFNEVCQIPKHYRFDIAVIESVVNHFHLLLGEEVVLEVDDQSLTVRKLPDDVSECFVRVESVFGEKFIPVGTRPEDRVDAEADHRSTEHHEVGDGRSLLALDSFY